MKQFKHKKILAIGALGLGVLLLTSCTANFCSPVDKAAMAYPYEQGVTVYVTKDEYDKLKASPEYGPIINKQEAISAQALGYGLPTMAGPAFAEDGVTLNNNVYKYVPYTGSGDTITLQSTKSDGFLKSFLENAGKNGYSLPSVYYYAVIDDYVLKAATTQFLVGPEFNYATPADYETKILADEGKKAALANIIVGSELTDEQLADKTATYVTINPYREVDPKEKGTEIPIDRSVLRKYGKLKFSGFNVENKDRPYFGFLDAWNDEIREKTKLGFELLGILDVPGIDYSASYKAQLTAKVDSVRSCIATRDGNYGHYGTFADWRVAIEQKDWGYAWGKGFLEGLLVYPVTWLLDTMAFGMDPALTGTGQILALVFVTLIVRGILLAVSFRSTMDSQKMQALQPELAKLQQKYPNSQTNQAEKQRMSQEQMMLYRRHGIKPFRQMLVMIVQFPVFICVWAGLQGSAALSTGEFLNMRLSDNINTILFNVSGAWYTNVHGWWTALILFLLMAGTQIMAMMLPKILAKRASKGVAKTAVTQQNNTMKWVSYGLIIFTIIMGFFLPSAMGVYWLIGGVISMIQTLITQAIMAKARKAGTAKKGK